MLIALEFRQTSKVHACTWVAAVSFKALDSPAVQLCWHMQLHGCAIEVDWSFQNTRLWAPLISDLSSEACEHIVEDLCLAMLRCAVYSLCAHDRSVKRLLQLLSLHPITTAPVWIHQLLQHFLRVFLLAWNPSSYSNMHEILRRIMHSYQQV